MRRVQPRQRSNINRQFTKQFIGNSWQFICFSAIQASTGAPKFEKTKRLEAILPAGCTPFKILRSGIERMGTVCGDMCSA